MRQSIAVVLTAGLALTACTSSGGDAPTPSGSAATSSSTSLQAGASAALVAARMRKGLAGLTSAHIAVDAGTLGGTSVGNVAYTNGQATASDITVDSGSDRTRIVTVGSASYAKLPANRNTSGKPWVKVSTTSKNEFVRTLAASVDINKAASSLPAVADVAGSATAVRAAGTNRYALTVEPAKAGDSELATLLGGVGQDSVPVDLQLDPRGRPTKIVIAFKLGTQSFDVTIMISGFDRPVSISAPPADMISAG